MRLLTPVVLVLAAAAAVPAATHAFHRTAADPRAVLRRVERAETAYRAAHGRFTASLRALGVPRVDGVEVRIVAQGAAGYSAMATTHAEECAVFHGAARPPRAWARTPGRVACRGR